MLSNVYSQEWSVLFVFSSWSQMDFCKNSLYSEHCHKQKLKSPISFQLNVPHTFWKSSQYTHKTIQVLTSTSFVSHFFLSENLQRLIRTHCWLDSSVNLAHWFFWHMYEKLNRPFKFLFFAISRWIVCSGCIPVLYLRQRKAKREVLWRNEIKLEQCCWMVSLCVNC